ncbi:glucokinase regulatory protein-like isoform X1 [Grammomys surdaster]|uniref:glucokinase regulatory protein-like isoform X1 n=1 Tax=Grammomys surdaster TaxID=491861 RepID=UPI0010A051D2|nr:glucokinase regulatory protein-like isoform X1 [Grammomys surdaster]
MLDLCIANSKLFWRALATLQRFSGQSKARCIESLLQVIHFPQWLLDDVRAAPISCHVQVAHEKEKVPFPSWLFNKHFLRTLSTFGTLCDTTITKFTKL